jgi:iron complex transport system substrate-binding protein
VKAEESRIVSIGGAITEIVYALGKGDLVVGRDTSSYYPSSVGKVPTVGYVRQLNPEGILSLRPTLVIGPEGLNPPTIVGQLENAKVQVSLLPKVDSCNDTKISILTLGKLLNAETEASKLLKTLERDLKLLDKALTSRTNLTKKRVLMLYVRGNRSQFILGKGSGPGVMLQIAGAKNVGEQVDGVKPITAEAMVALNPEVLVFFKKGVDSIGGTVKLNDLPGVPFTKAGKEQRFVIMDDLYLAGFGPRCGKAALDLFNGIHQKTGVYVDGVE